MAARHVRITTLSALVLCFSASMAAAQQREGFWFGVGGGFGSASVSCSDCDGEREGGATSYLTAGWAATNRLLVGGEFSLWSKSATIEESFSGQLHLYNVLGTVRFYPNPSSGFFVKGGSGLSIVNTTGDIDGTNVSVDLGQGLTFVAGAGYDFTWDDGSGSRRSSTRGMAGSAR